MTFSLLWSQSHHRRHRRSKQVAGFSSFGRQIAATGSFSVGLLLISMGALVGAVVLWALGHDRRLEHAPGMHGRAHSAKRTELG